MIHISQDESRRLRTANGGYVFMSWHRIMGPEFYYDKWHNRPINDWLDNCEVGRFGMVC